MFDAKFYYKVAVRELADELSSIAMPASSRNSAFAAGISAYEPGAKVVISPFVDCVPGYAALIEHPRLGDIVVVEMPE